MQRITSRLDVHLSPGDQASRSPVLAELLEARLCLSTVTFPTTPDEYLVGQGNLSYPALADFNGDGHLDIAEANDSAPNPTGGTVSVLLNKGDGTYNAATTLQAGGRPFEAIAGDFNGDTHQDLVVSNAQDGTLDFYAGNGSGGFAAGVLSTYGNPATVGEGVLASIAAADLNGDGKLDLIVSDEHDNKLTTMLGDGAGSFAVSQQISGIFTSIVTGDFNADGHADVVSVGSNGNVIDLYLNTGTGGQLATVTPLNTGAAGGSQGGGLVTGDFNGDAKPDLALLTKSVTSDTAPFTVFLNQGGGTFSAAITTNLQFAADLAVGDFDGDGKLDIVTTNEVNLVVYPGNGDGTVQTTAAFNLQNFNMSGGPSVGDVNGDAKPDIIAFGSIAASTLPGPVMSVFINGQTGDGGGGGGGGGGAATLTPTIASSTVPTALVGGQN